MIDDLRAVLAELDAADKQLVDLRTRRAAIVAGLRAEGWSLQRIADAVGRTKQTIDQWTRG